MSQKLTKKQREEVSDLVISYPKYDYYKKKFYRGHNFDYKLVITPETRGTDHPGMHFTGICTWWEARGKWKISRADMVRLIEKKTIIHTWKDPYEEKSYEGKFKFVNREPTEKEWKKKIDEMNKSNRKFWLVVSVIGLVILLIYNN